MKPFDKILLVYDGSPEAECALTRCLQLAAGLSASVDVISAVDTEHLNAVSGGLLTGDAFAHLHLHAERTVSDAMTRLQSHGVIARGHVGIGAWVDVLPRQAALLSSDMVMIGQQARESVSRRWKTLPLYVRVAERLRGLTLVTVTCP